MADCTNVGLLGALEAWSSGIKLDNYCIYGYSTVWIGRAAKLLALLAAIPLIVDLVGEERVHARSHQLSGSMRSLLTGMASKARKAMDVGDTFVTAPTILKGFRYLARAIPHRYVYIVLAILLLQIAALAIYFRFTAPSLSIPLALVLGWVVLQLFIASTITFMVIALVLIVGTLFLTAAALRTDVLCWYIRFIASGMFLLSFSLDFLASS
jgi:hypothetical protein